MPNEQDAGNGMTTFSLHALDESSSDAIEQLREEQTARPGLIPEAVVTESDLDPETVARRYLQQALASEAVPSMTAPVVYGTASKFKTISTETVPLTGDPHREVPPDAARHPGLRLVGYRRARRGQQAGQHGLRSW